MTSNQLKAYELLRQVPKGKVTTYRELAKAMRSRAYRAVGQYMRNNPYPYMSCDNPDLRVPCHRVVASSGFIGGFMGKTNGDEIQRKIELLKSEGVHVFEGKVQDFTNKLFTFSL